MASPCRDEAQEGYNRVEAVFKSKVLEIHPIKSFFLLFVGKGKTRDSIKEEISRRPLVYDDFILQSTNEEKWLGDILSDQGLKKSVEATINRRYGKVLTAIFELKSILEDLRMQMIGGIKCGLDIWELAIIPSLANNAGVWVEVSPQSIEKLNKLQNTFLQSLFAVGQSCPKPALCWDTTTLLMEVRISKAKLALLHHITTLDNTSLAKQVYTEQLSNGWPGLVTECQAIMKEWSLPDITKTNEKMSKNEWENIVKKEAKLQNTKLLYNMIKNYSKLDIMKKEA